MAKLNTSIIFETAFGIYRAAELIGEGGAGKVYGGTSDEGSPVAIKLLAGDRISTDKRRRFKNETSFLARNKHANIITVHDHGVTGTGKHAGPFYVMARYASNLRSGIQNVSLDQRLALFSRVL